MGNVAGLMEKNLNIAEEAVKRGIGFEYGGFVFGAGMGRGNALEATVGGKDELIKNQKEIIDRLEKENESLRNQVAEQANKGQSNLMNVIEMMTKSQANSPYPSRPGTPSNNQ